MAAFRTRNSLVLTVGLFAAGALMYACSSPQPAAAPPRAPELWGDMKPVVSVKELMRDMIDPIADNIFDAVSIVVDARARRNRAEDRRRLGQGPDRRRDAWRKGRIC